MTKIAPQTGIARNVPPEPNSAFERKSDTLNRLAKTPSHRRAIDFAAMRRVLICHFTKQRRSSPPNNTNGTSPTSSPAMSARQAAIEAARCLYCFDAPCTIACPTHIDVPAFIKKISTGNLRGSARVILSANILGESCGRVCPTEVLCEGACVMHEKGETPIEIGRLQRYAVDYVRDRKIELFQRGAPNGKRVACIGAGPASLACAAELAKWGYDVTIFDRNELPGGLNTYGIAAYKTRASDSLREVEMIRDLGVKFRQKVQVGRDISFADLETAVRRHFHRRGLGRDPGTQAAGRRSARCLRRDRVHRENESRAFLGGRSWQASRLHRRGQHGHRRGDGRAAARRRNRLSDLPPKRARRCPRLPTKSSWRNRMRSFFSGRRSPCAFSGSDGVVTGLECVRTRLGSAGRQRPPRRPEPVPGTEFTLDVDMVVRAVGQKPVTEFLARREWAGAQLQRHGAN